MAEEKIFIDSGGLKIEGLLENLPGDRGVVVTHPHPLYGGDMYNNVVEAVVQAYREQEYSTLRFNFRGVGKSQGAYDNGIGEQEDIRAALRCLSDLGKKAIDLAGYSFGAWVNALGIEKFDSASRLILVSPPVNFINFDFLKSNPKIQLIIVGTQDDIANPLVVEKMWPKWNPDSVFRTVEGADHFYSGKTNELKIVIQEFLT